MPRAIAIVPTKARSIIITRYGTKYFSDLTMELKIVFSLSTGLYRI
jgi:hypothetical protein